MKAEETNLLTLLKKVDQFIIPIYQRTYSWNIQQCRQLWEDITRIVQDDTASGHFLGSIVYIGKSAVVVHTSINPVLVIDGQQRLTTLSLLLAALGKVLAEDKAATDINRKKIDNFYLFNPDEDGEDRYKLLLTRGDKDTLIALLEGRDLPKQAAQRIEQNYNFFLQQIRAWSGNIDTLWQGIGKLFVVAVALEHGKDNPQLIFESLNSTGLDLSQADLIRNYLLMQLDNKQQTELYNHYWYPMEQAFDPADPSQFDRFVRDYLTVKTGQIPNIRDIYTSFKAYAERQRAEGVATAEFVAEVYRYARDFVELVRAQVADVAIQEALADISALKVEVAYPFLLAVYRDYKEHRLTDSEFATVLGLIESYVFRRTICGIATNSLNKTFTTLYRQIKPDRYVESLQAVLLNKESFTRFPRDDEFRAEFVRRDVYTSPRRNYLLGKLENYGSKERVQVETLTVEHIMPQNRSLSPAWIAELGSDWQAVQDRYLHTIGNLTLTGYNSELGTRSFQDKRDMAGGFAASPLRLNKSLATTEHWDEAAICRRATALAQRALQIWPAPSLPDAVLATYRRKPTAPKAVTDEPRKWNEADFFRELAFHTTAEDVAVARTILVWGHAQNLRIWWGEGKVDGSFFPMFDYKNEPYWLIAVWTSGKIEVQFQHMKPRPPFDSEAQRLELLNRLNTVPSITISVARISGCPSFPLSALRDPASLQHFLQTLDWAIEQIKAAY
ncbi:MAG: DUF262 domain-containing protein [Chloroflexota bacterium]|nr:DUF262 domain-containing protein [Chloroflexota bacterium]